MRDYLVIGSSPYAEDCAQVGRPNYQEQSRKELRAYINQLKRCFPALNDDDCRVVLKIKSNSHDFGTYYEVVAYFDDEDETQCDIAYSIEGDGPEYWDDEAKQELGLI